MATCTTDATDLRAAATGAFFVLFAQHSDSMLAELCAMKGQHNRNCYEPSFSFIFFLTVVPWVIAHILFLYVISDVGSDGLITVWVLFLITGGFLHMVHLWRRRTKENRGKLTTVERITILVISLTHALFLAIGAWQLGKDREGIYRELSWTALLGLSVTEAVVGFLHYQRSRVAVVAKHFAHVVEATLFPLLAVTIATVC